MTLKGASNTMWIVRNRNALQYFVHFLLICAALIYGPQRAVAQTADSSGEQAQGAQSVSQVSLMLFPELKGNPGSDVVHGVSMRLQRFISIRLSNPLCLAKTSYTCRMNDLAQSSIRAFPI